MTRPWIALDPGARYSGLCLGWGAEVWEACTVVSRPTVSIDDPRLDLPALVDLGARTVGTALDMLRDHSPALAEHSGDLLVVMEGLVLPTPTRAGGKGVAGITRRVIAGAMGCTGTATVVLASLYAAGLGEPLIVDPAGFDKIKTGHPSSLDKRIPREWKKAYPERQRTAPREHQRAAYHLAQAGLRQAGGIRTVKPLFPVEPVKANTPAAPATRAEYLAALIAYMAGDTSIAAAQAALAAIPAPPGAPALPAQALADHAATLTTRSA